MSTTLIRSTFSPISKLVNNVPLAEQGSPLTTKTLVKTTEKDAMYFRELEKKNIFLNEHQLEAVRVVNGPLLINAGAGSGKTSVIVCRVGYLLSVAKISPENLLLVTFTKKAADEMKERISKLPGITPFVKRQITSGTFHSVALQILRTNGCKKGIVASERQKQYHIKMILKGMSITDEYEPESILTMISFYKSHGMLPADIKGDKAEEEFIEIFKKYQEKLNKQNQMDFDDMLIECYNLLQENPFLLAKYQDKFKYVICDESQDTNPIQFKIIQLLATSHNLCLCGDTDQSIYGYRAAEIKYMLEFSKMYPNARIITLDTNYRSTNSIVGLGNRVIEFNKNRIKKTLNTVFSSEKHPYFYRPSNQEEEAEMIVRMIKEMIKEGKKQYKDIAVLYRTNSTSRTIVDTFITNEIPFVFHGKVQSHFYQNSFVKPVIDLLRLSVDSKDINALINIAPILYLKKETINTLLLSISVQEAIEQKEYPNKFEMVVDLLSSQLKPYQLEQLKKKSKVIKTLVDINPVKAIQEIRKGLLSYDKYLEMNKKKTLTFHKEMIIEMLDEVEDSAKKFSTVKEYLLHIDHIIKQSAKLDDIKKQEDYNGVQLMTIHCSKGLEFDTVFLIGMIDGVLPHKTALHASEQEDRIKKTMSVDLTEEAIEEERRLGYVAITRAKYELYISAPCHYHKKNKEVSRFLTEALEWK